MNYYPPSTCHPPPLSTFLMLVGCTSFCCKNHRKMNGIKIKIQQCFGGRRRMETRSFTPHSFRGTFFSIHLPLTAGGADSAARFFFSEKLELKAIFFKGTNLISLLSAQINVDKVVYKHGAFFLSYLAALKAASIRNQQLHHNKSPWGEARRVGRKLPRQQLKWTLRHLESPHHHPNLFTSPPPPTPPNNS